MPEHYRASPAPACRISSARRTAWVAGAHPGRVNHCRARSSVSASGLACKLPRPTFLRMRRPVSRGGTRCSRRTQRRRRFSSRRPPLSRAPHESATTRGLARARGRHAQRGGRARVCVRARGARVRVSSWFAYAGPTRAVCVWGGGRILCGARRCANLRRGEGWLEGVTRSVGAEHACVCVRVRGARACASSSSAYAGPTRAGRVLSAKQGSMGARGRAGLQRDVGSHRLWVTWLHMGRGECVCKQRVLVVWARCSADWFSQWDQG